MDVAQSREAEAVLTARQERSETMSEHDDARNLAEGLKDCWMWGFIRRRKAVGKLKELAARARRKLAVCDSLIGDLNLDCSSDAREALDLVPSLKGDDAAVQEAIWLIANTEDFWRMMRTQMLKSELAWGEVKKAIEALRGGNDDR